MDDVQSLIEKMRFCAENGPDTELLKRAADKIQELVADLGDADAMTEYWMKKNKWIRCEDRLPENEGRYLAIFYEEMIIDFGYYRPSVGWCEQGITHWMPLPKAPEVEG